MKKLLILGLLLVLSLGLLSGCQSGGSSADDEPFVFIVGVSFDAQNYNPDLRVDDGAYSANQNIFSRLIKLGPKDNIIPDLAESYEFSADGLTLTFHLHSGVKWHDGEPFSSADVKWTFDTMKAEAWSQSFILDNVIDIECPDDNTVVFNMSSPDAAIIARLAWYGTFIMPKHIYEGTDVSTNPANESPIGTGPFKFSVWEKGVGTTLVKNEDYFGQVPEIDELVFSIIPDEQTRYQAFINGEVDYIGTMPSSNFNDLDDDPNYRFIQQIGINRLYIAFNMNTELGGDLAFRQAVAYAIDQQSIKDRCMPAGEVAVTFVSPLFEDYADYNYTLPEYNLDKAIEILEAAGYTKNADGYYIEVDFPFFNSSNWADVAQVIKANLDKAGIKLNLNMMEISAWQTAVIDDDDFVITMLAGYQGPDISGIYNRVGTGAAANVPNYSDPEMDEWLLKGQTTTAVADRAAAYSEVQRIMSEDLPMVLIYDNGYKYVFKVAYTGYPMDVPDKAGASEYTYVTKVK
ncbi:MAG: ABC transporter substrate-binding protein [Erysipelotrichaceae bacterium]|jgi:peptide/nickel transport system substrate-binding protein|nr:ABC transporter substrate-binding protein [Erysipelotrichaceae bacterium]